MSESPRAELEFDELRAALQVEIDDWIRRARERGVMPGDLGDVTALAGRMAAALPVPHPVAAQIGPCYDTSGLVEWLGISKQALHKRLLAGKVLGCRTADGHWVYPAWQFDDHGSTIPALADVLTALGADPADGWRAGSWLTAPSPDLPDGVSAAAWLTQGGDSAPVLVAARRDAARWAA